MNISQPEVGVGEKVTISALVRNIGEEPGTYDLEVVVGGVMEERKSIALGGGESEWVSFSVIRNEPGFYNVRVDNLLSEFEVRWIPPTLTHEVDDAPAILTYDPKEYEVKPTAMGYFEPGYSFQLSWSLHYTFAEAGGLARVWLKNQGTNALFVYQVGVSGDWVPKEYWYPKDVGFTVWPNKEVDLGLVGFPGPTTTGEHQIKFGISILAETELEEWYDYGTQYVEPDICDFEGLVQERRVEYKESEYDTFKKLNELVDPNAPGVREKALSLAGKYAGEYNVYQLCALFDWVRDEIPYVSDPRGVEYWSPPDETLKAMAGDCEDHAILLSSMIEAIGGVSRIILTEDHAFASVYIGDENYANRVMEAIELFYGETSPFAYWVKDGDGWLVLESTGGLYPGDLPVGAKFTSEA